MAGHHLFSHFPLDDYPWVHLWTEFERLLSEKAADQWSLDRFRELNKVTHDEIRGMFTRAGFDIVAEHRGTPDDAKRARLDRVRDRIRPEFLERESLLFEDWTRLVGVRRD
jgi:hypothetical protein